MSTAILSRGIGTGIGSAPASRLHLTKRGRFVITTAVSIPLVVAALGFALNGGIATATNGTGSLRYVTVQSGETLWQLATTIAPTTDPRDVVADIASLNQLSGSTLQPGQRIAIPAKYER